MQTNPIPGVMNTLKEAGFNEEQRLAITTSITDMQYHCSMQSGSWKPGSATKRWYWPP